MPLITRKFFLFFVLIISSLLVCHGAIVRYGWDSSTKNLIDADIIIDKINNGEDITFGPESIIVGDLILDNLKNKSIKGNININSEITGKFIARNKIFTGNVYIWNSNIHKDVSFFGSVFLKDAIFYGTNFENTLSFDDVIFEEDAIFEGVVCTMSASFHNATFMGYNTFLKATFNGRADFSLSKFDKRGEFQYSDFRGRALFYKADFRDGLTFLGSDFSKDIEFYGAKFGGDALFESIKCDDAMYFNDKTSVGLNGAEFSKSVSFKNSAIKYLDLNHCSFSKEYNLILNNCDFYSLNSRWDDIKDHIIFDESLYIKLTNYYRGVAQFHDADACYREYNLKSKKESLEARALSKFLWITSDFGTNAWRTITILIFLSLLFALIYFRTKSIRRKDRPYHYLHFRDCLYFSLMVSVNFSSDYIPLGRWRWVVLAERVIGWILLAILIITIVRLGLR